MIRAGRHSFHDLESTIQNQRSQAIKGRTLLFAFVDGKLLPKRQIFQNQCTVTFCEEPNQPKQTQDEAEHGSRFFLLYC